MVKFVYIACIAKLLVFVPQTIICVLYYILTNEDMKIHRMLLINNFSLIISHKKRRSLKIKFSNPKVYKVLPASIVHSSTSSAA